MSTVKPLSPAEIEAANQITALVRQFEDCFDATVTKGAELAAALPRFRAIAQLPAVAGQSALDSIGEAITAAIRGRGHVVNGHRILDRTAVVLGYDTTEFGDGRPKPPFEEPKGTIVPLRTAA